ASGRQGDALEVLRRARRVLRDELGVDPGPALRQLERDVLAQVEDLAPVPARSSLDQLPPAVPTHRDRLVGRLRELTALRADCDAAAAGCGGLVMIYGEAGSGKTALVQRLALTVSASTVSALTVSGGRVPGWQVAIGRCP